MQTKLNDGNLIKALNIWVVAVVRYSAAFIDWTRLEIKRNGKKNLKIDDNAYRIRT